MSVIRAIWRFLRWVGCELFSLHSRPGILLAKVHGLRKAEVVSDARPVVIIRRVRSVEERVCPWCGTVWTRVGWELVTENDLSPRAPGEGGARA